MKRITTILKQISALEKELDTNYTALQIVEAYDKLYEQNKLYRPCDGLVSVIKDSAQMKLNNLEED